MNQMPNSNNWDLWGILDWFQIPTNLPNERDTLLRFKDTFPKPEIFIKVVDELHSVVLSALARRDYSRLWGKYCNCLMDWKVSTLGYYRLKSAMIRYQPYLQHLKELNNLSLKGLSSEDHVSTNAVMTANSRTQHQTQTSDATENINSASYNANGDYDGDSDAPIDDTKWKAKKNLVGGTQDNHQNSNNVDTDGNGDEGRTSINTIENTDVTYMIDACIKLINNSLDETQEYWDHVFNEIMSTIATDYNNSNRYGYF